MVRLNRKSLGYIRIITFTSHLQRKLEREMLSLLKLTARRMKARHWDALDDKIVSHQLEDLWL